MSSSDQIDDPLHVESEDDQMDDIVLPGSILDILNDSGSITDHTEQVPKGDEGVGDMETDQVDPETAKAEELNLQVTVPVDPKEDNETPEPAANIEAADKDPNPESVKILTDQIIGDNARKDVDEMDDLDGYLDLIMCDQTMSIARAKKGGDLVAVIECPDEDHKVDLIKNEGFFLIDLASLARRTMDGMLKFADEIQFTVGCAGHPDCQNIYVKSISEKLCPNPIWK